MKYNYITMIENNINLHIPCGLRCHTKEKMKTIYDIKSQETLLFDNGFISPYSIKKLLNTKYININLDNTAPCIKIEKYMENDKKGIKFIESSYEEINKYIEKNGYNNQYLDSTKGYYTLLKDYDCILAHYNWHKSSDKNITNPKKNIKIIEEIINRRKLRLENMIKNSDTLHIYYDKADADFIIINKEKFNLSIDIVKEYLILTFTKYKKKIICNEL